jgi:hypothetical protein
MRKGHRSCYRTGNRGGHVIRLSACSFPPNALSLWSASASCPPTRLARPGPLHPVPLQCGHGSGAVENAHAAGLAGADGWASKWPRLWGGGELHGSQPHRCLRPSRSATWKKTPCGASSRALRPMSPTSQTDFTAPESSPAEPKKSISGRPAQNPGNAFCSERSRASATELR